MFMFNDIFVDQLISDGRIIKLGGGELATDDHYLIEILDDQGRVLSRATGYELEKVFIEVFQATPPRAQLEGESENCCPNCGSSNIRIVDWPKDKPVEVMKCDTCGYSWDEEKEASRPLYHEGDKGDKLTELQINGVLSRQESR